MPSSPNLLFADRIWREKFHSYLPAALLNPASVIIDADLYTQSIIWRQEIASLYIFVYFVYFCIFLCTSISVLCSDKLYFCRILIAKANSGRLSPQSMSKHKRWVIASVSVPRHHSASLRILSTVHSLTSLSIFTNEGRLVIPHFLYGSIHSLQHPASSNIIQHPSLTSRLSVYLSSLPLYLFSLPNFAIN